MYINSSLWTHPKISVSTRKNQLSAIHHNIKTTYTGIGFQQRIHKHQLYTNSSVHFQSNNSTNHENLQTSKHLTSKIHQLHFQPTHSMKNYILTIISTTEEYYSLLNQNNNARYPTKSNRNSVSTYYHPTQNIEPQLTKPWETTVPCPTASFKRSNSTKMNLTGSNHITSRIHVSFIYYIMTTQP
jgi:hypothetical protein